MECISSQSQSNVNMFLFIYLFFCKLVSKYSPLTNCTRSLSGKTTFPFKTAEIRTRLHAQVADWRWMQTWAELLSTLLLAANKASHLRWQRVEDPIKALTTFIITRLCRNKRGIRKVACKVHRGPPPPPPPLCLFEKIHQSAAEWCLENLLNHFIVAPSAFPLCGVGIL